MKSLLLHPKMRPLLAKVGSYLRGSRVSVRGQGNIVALSDSIRRRCRLRIRGNHNQITFDPGCRLWDVDIEVIGENHRLKLGPGCEIRGGRWVLEDNHSTLEIGSSVSMIGDTLVASEGTGIFIGSDCMFSSNVEVRSSDGHSILSSPDGERVNPARDVRIGDHVWLGAGVRVLKGCVLGRDTIVAAGAVVARSLPAASVAVGIPARVVRTGCTWSRDRRLTSPVSANREDALLIPSQGLESIPPAA